MKKKMEKEKLISGNTSDEIKFLTLKPRLFSKRNWSELAKIIIEKTKNEIVLIEQELVEINVKLTSFQKEVQTSIDHKIRLDMTILNLTNQVQELENNIKLLTTEQQNLTGKKIVLEDDKDLNEILNKTESTNIKKNYDCENIKSKEDIKKPIINLLWELERELNLPHNQEMTISPKLKITEKKKIYGYFRELYSQVEQTKITHSEINDFLTQLGVKPDCKPNEFQLNIIKEIEKELEIPERNLTNRLGAEVDEYFDSLNAKIKNSKVSSNELKKLFDNLRLNRFLSTKSLMNIKKQEWYKKMYYINADGKDRNLITKQHYLPRTLIQRWANSNLDYFATNKKTNSKKKFNTVKYEGDPFYAINLYEIGGNTNGNMTEHSFNKVEIALNSTIKKIQSQISKQFVKLDWIDLKILIQYLICSKFRTKAWFEKNIENNLLKSDDLFWNKFFKGKDNHNQVIWEIQKFLEFLVIDWGLDIIESDSIYFEKELKNVYPLINEIENFHTLNHQITKSFDNYIESIINVFKDEDIINVMAYKVYEFIENTKIAIFKISEPLNNKFIIPDTAVINLNLEQSGFYYPIIELFPLTEKIAFAFIRQTIDSNTSDLNSTILNSNLNFLFPNLFDKNLKNNKKIPKKLYPYSNETSKLDVMIYELNNKKQIDFINENAINQAYENYIEKED